MHRVLSDVARVAPGATRQITGDRGDPLVAKRGRLLELQAQFESLDASYVAMLAAVRACPRPLRAPRVQSALA